MYLLSLLESKSVCVRSRRKRAAPVYTPPFQPTPKHFDNQPLWPFTKINITCDPWPQLGRSKAGPPAGWGVFKGVGYGALFVMLISWPNLNDPDICCPACVKPHIQFVPQIQKAGKTLEAGENVCCVCVLVVDVVWVKGKNPFYFHACIRAIITSREES